MRYISKGEPNFFITDTKKLQQKIKIAQTDEEKVNIWDNQYKNKRALKEYILENEQNYLCGYCEAKVMLDNSHIEHIEPKSLDYDKLTFEYSNLIVSCNGVCFTDDNTPISCGHKKNKKFNKSAFLNPTKVQDIRDYFIYTNNCHIKSSNKDKQKSGYTLNLLQLNHRILKEAREKALEEFRKSIQKNARSKNVSLNEVAKILLNKENLAFISFLRYRYKKLLQGT